MTMTSAVVTLVASLFMLMAMAVAVAGWHVADHGADIVDFTDDHRTVNDRCHWCRRVPNGRRNDNGRRLVRLVDRC